MKALPIVAIATCLKKLEFDMEHYCSRTTYCDAVLNSSNAMPLLLPSMGGEKLYKNGVLENIDGLVLTGSLSNVNPFLYGQEKESAKHVFDKDRDETTLFLIKKAIEKKVPVLAICRGLQEFNVSFGGDLFQKVHEQKNVLNHRTNFNDKDPEKRVNSHKIKINKGGILEKIVKEQNIKLQEGKIVVNTSHSQAIKNVADMLTIEATADDNIVEAVSFNGSENFALAVQFHPEVDWKNNNFYKGIFIEFGKAVKAYKDKK